ncbi:tetratricopeptide repeat protein [Anabaena cylindrica FACHB-243]|uniref:Tetratricopeptide TPR_2 repeat-containing protein n=1 Tax=Anabaena cylindrica (strain ATCC 27899 / PCC 7122) TaxID=272123 RepID=K9ZJF3_ANACC|nr:MULTISPECIES: tetratricopeptide repeat protein [Anabaena]AFZ58677.1 Tetratricopeptide TPR_2 repeat-containing protein [Anabaena cylindrica PCC 7122]MBD2420022.1 tetratricopeptide repeat protein [Anabaena cylindrica FACHB-243]MBY5283007.1 tetratricopeptide repeat protein [Anabaena sp. CCAP 1446/1C]MBY5306494.1 tetratricopeptide repeat protein [Anabaena sp. CCAP 1446/1C]MCM2407083.1 tetratricopeptide repeat protein [Anabaena sp. CCAP 1446/1C]
MKCPVCGVVYRPTKGTGEKRSGEQEGETDSNTSLFPPPVSSPTCRRCKADLSDLLSLHDQAIWYHRQALHLLSTGRYPEAATQNNQALALYYSNADFHALAGKLSALQGEWREAIASWQQALKFDPQNAIACDCLQMIKLMAKSN